MVPPLDAAVAGGSPTLDRLSWELHIGFGNPYRTGFSIGASRDPGGAIDPLASAEVGPVNEDLSRTRGIAWRDVGLCRDQDPNLFYPLGRGRSSVQQAEAAKVFCRVCPSREPCLAFALATDQRLGVWGATTPEERRRLLGRRRRTKVAS